MSRRIHAPRRLVFVLALSFQFVGAVIARDKQTLPESNPSYQAEAKSLVGRILKRADKAKCHPNSCTILVANFTTPFGSTSRLGIQLADSISAELLSQEHGIQIVDRSRLQDYLIREHISSNLLKDWEAARWLASQLQANTVLVGSIEQQGDRFDLLVELLNASDEKIGSEEAIDISVRDPQGSLAPFEPYDAESSRAKITPGHGSAAFRAGANGTSVPECIYCPTPLYSNAARKARFKGTVVLEVIVMEDGRAGDISVLKGIPFGLNGEAIKAVRAWKFKPANDKGGMPMSVAVPIEMTFNLS
jgi:TonB family protein